ncbi:MAG: type VI secretion system contractile sheath small subunit [Deltaproteobacteria bacterium]|nr:type VI secretion system contractile sheath small subunit [Deltaproteobacteria bacterium]
MPEPITFGEIEFKLVADMENPAGAPDSEEPFRILIMGDFSGRTNCGVSPSGTAWANQRPIRINRDNFDAMMAKLGIGLKLPMPEKTVPFINIRFSELEDFHPDRLYERLGVFQALRDTRKSLENPVTFTAVAGALKGARPYAEAPATGPVSGDLLDQII